MFHERCQVVYPRERPWRRFWRGTPHPVTHRGTRVCEAVLVRRESLGFRGAGMARGVGLAMLEERDVYLMVLNWKEVYLERCWHIEKEKTVSLATQLQKEKSVSSHTKKIKYP